MISIVIPTLNEAKHLEETLKNLQAGFRTIPYEIIISDGRSTDETIVIAKKYTNKIVVYQEKKRQTIAQARNMGAAVAKGEHIVFIDADVLIPNAETFFSMALKLFSTKRYLVGLSVMIGVNADQASLADTFFYCVINRFHVLMNNILGRGVASGEFQMVEAKAFNEVGGYCESLVATEDYDLFWRLSKIGRTRLEPKLKIFHSGRRIHKLGWPRLLWLWFTNTMSAIFFRRSASKEWEPIR